VEIKAIQTHYKGYKFRARLEARWAIWLDNINEKWEYEAEGFQIGKMRYLPDFFLPDRNIFVEVKGPSYSDVDRQKVLALEEASKKYVIVVGDKVFQIANQNAAGLATLAGSKVKITGELKGDAVTISKIEKTQ